MRRIALAAFVLLWSGLLCAGPMPRANGEASVPVAPPRAEGDGPYGQLILRGVTVIDGTGAPAYGPADVVIEIGRAHV